MAQQTDTDTDEPTLSDTYEATLNNDRDLDDRTRRSREERMVVIPQTDDHTTCIGLYDVITTGGSYLVDGVDSVCDCPDMEYNNPEQGCKHVRRVRYMVANTELPGEGDDADDYLDALQLLHGDISREVAELRDRLRAAEDILDALERQHYAGP